MIFSIKPANEPSNRWCCHTLAQHSRRHCDGAYAFQSRMITSTRKSKTDGRNPDFVMAVICTCLRALRECSKSRYVMGSGERRRFARERDNHRCFLRPLLSQYRGQSIRNFTALSPPSICHRKTELQSVEYTTSVLPCLRCRSTSARLPNSPRLPSSPSSSTHDGAAEPQRTDFEIRLAQIVLHHDVEVDDVWRIV